MSLFQKILEEGSACVGCSEDDAYRTARAFGWLAAWWLKKSVLIKASQRALDQHEKAIWSNPEKAWAVPDARKWVKLLLVNQLRDPLSPVRPVLVLPLMWASNRSHDRRLPEKLVETADRVLLAIQTSKDRADEKWGLIIPCDDSLLPTGFGNLSMRFESGWLPLAGNLWVRSRTRDSQPDSKLWSTGAWGPEEGVTEIEYVKEKAEAAREFGAAKMLIPNPLSKQDFELSDLEIISLEENRRNLEKVFRIFADSALCAPEPNAGFHEHLEFYKVLQKAASEQTAAEYKQRVLDPFTIERCRGFLERGGCPRLPYLVTFMAKPGDAGQISARSIPADNCLLMLMLHHDSASAERLKTAAVDIRQNAALRGTKMLIDECDSIHQITGEWLEARVKAWMGVNCSERVAYDITPGNKPLLLSILRIASDNDLLFYLKHSYDSEGRIEAGSEQYEIRLRRDLRVLRGSEI